METTCEEKRIYPVELIQKSVSNFFGLRHIDIFRNTRKREIITARQFFYYMCRRHTKRSLKDIGLIPESYGLKKHDHATVLHAENKVSGFMDIYPEYRFFYREITANIEREIPNYSLVEEVDLLKIAEHNTKLQSKFIYLTC